MKFWRSTCTVIFSGLIFMLGCGEPVSPKNETPLVTDAESATNNFPDAGTADDVSAADDATSPDDGASEPPTVPVEAYGQKNWEVLCEVAFECPRATHLWLVRTLSGYETVEACQQASRPPLRMVPTPETLLSIEEGRVTYDGAAAAECLAGLKAHMCGGTFEPFEPCTRVFQGLAEEAEFCRSYTDCAGDLVCRGIYDGDACDAACQQPGSPCGDTVCGAEQYCDRTSETCESRKAIGSACHYGQCEQGATCTHSADDAGTCVANQSQAAGDPCVIDWACQSGLVCDSGICAAATFAPAGEPCARVGARACEPGLVCRITDLVTQTGTCGAPLESDEACVDSTECSDNLVCTGVDTNPTCRAPAEDGASCTANAYCMSWNCQFEEGSLEGVCQPFENQCI